MGLRRDFRLILHSILCISLFLVLVPVSIITLHHYHHLLQYVIHVYTYVYPTLAWTLPKDHFANFTINFHSGRRGYYNTLDNTNTEFNTAKITDKYSRQKLVGEVQLELDIVSKVLLSVDQTDFPSMIFMSLPARCWCFDQIPRHLRMSD